MKLFACILLSALLLLNAGCAAKQETTQSKPPTTNSRPPTTNSKPLTEAQPNDKAELRKLAREQSLVASKIQLAKDGIDARIGGANKDVLILKSSKVTNYNMLLAIRDGLEVFKEAGYTRIELTDSSGETRTVDLTALDIP